MILDAKLGALYHRLGTRKSSFEKVLEPEPLLSGTLGVPISNCRFQPFATLKGLRQQGWNPKAIRSL